MEFFPILRKLEQTDATWQGYVYNLPRGTMKFLLNSTITTLPTKVNLKLWGKVSNDKCRCCSRQTLNHILNCCGPSLRDGRYTFRHDNVLSYIAKCLNKQNYTCYIDLEGSQTSAGGPSGPNPTGPDLASHHPSRLYTGALRAPAVGPALT